MNVKKYDLNLLVYLDVLLREQNVTRAAEILGITQPAMSNVLRRIRTLFDDPVLVRTSEGMVPTERAMQLAPMIRNVVESAEKVVQPAAAFDALNSHRVFRISASDYAESALFPSVLKRLRDEAPNISLDILTPSDVGFEDVERGKIDMVINRFDTIPQTFRTATLWADTFTCILSRDNPLLEHFNLENYLKAKHVWVSKTGMGIGLGMNPQDVQRLGWVDEALNKIGYQRQITVFTRHYQAAMLLAQQQDLVVTLPTRAAALQKNNAKVVLMPPPFLIAPIELTMAWSPLLQHNAAHQWLRTCITEVAKSEIN